MERVRDTASKRQFEGFAAGAADALFRTGYLMTGDPRDAEDLVQETFLRAGRRWDRVRSMDHPTAYARRILINLALRDADRRTRHKSRTDAAAGRQRGRIPGGRPARPGPQMVIAAEQPLARLAGDHDLRVGQGPRRRWS
jgi:DNA-directed RNA polymerase specialized sigma24 family protein